MYELFGLKLELMSEEDKKRFDSDSVNIARELSTSYEGCLIGFTTRKSNTVPVEGDVYSSQELWSKLLHLERDFLDWISLCKGEQYIKTCRFNIRTKVMSLYSKSALREQYISSTFFVYNGMLLKFVDFV